MSGLTGLRKETFFKYPVRVLSAPGCQFLTMFLKVESVRLSVDLYLPLVCLNAAWTSLSWQRPKRCSRLSAKSAARNRYHQHTNTLMSNLHHHIMACVASGMWCLALGPRGQMLPHISLSRSYEQIMIALLTSSHDRQDQLATCHSGDVNISKLNNQLQAAWLLLLMLCVHILYICCCRSICQSLATELPAAVLLIAICHVQCVYA